MLLLDCIGWYTEYDRIINELPASGQKASVP